ncbi:MAG TPA: hypothetical protein PLU54_11875, partial [Deltaproteobacteria bacterium]|nr:hypothetical protein [Deltaproteobacteria bacterium]
MDIKGGVGCDPFPDSFPRGSVCGECEDHLGVGELLTVQAGQRALGLTRVDADSDDQGNGGYILAGCG